MITDEQKLKYNNMHYIMLNIYFRDACIDNELDVVKCLLTSPELNKNADIHFQSDSALTNACLRGNLEIVQYLLTSPELTEHANIDANDDMAFIYACNYKRMKIIEYLIFDYGIEKTKDIENYLIKDNRLNILTMFERRDFNKKLQKNLIALKNKSFSIKNKI